MSKTFEQAWAEMEARGYQYGGDALENVRFGWKLAQTEMLALREELSRKELERWNWEQSAIHRQRERDQLRAKVERVEALPAKWFERGHSWRDQPEASTDYAAGRELQDDACAAELEAALRGEAKP